MVRKIRHLNILVIFMLLLQLAVYPANVFGNEIRPTIISVEQAVRIVKDNFNIPEKYTRLSTGYNDNNNRATYSLNWNAVEEPGGMFYAQVDATTGDILNVNQWEHNTKQAFKLPVISATEAEKIATDLVSKLASKHQSEMQLVKDEQQVFSFNYMEPFMYNFRWNRTVNGIRFPENGVGVSVSGDGQVKNYNYNWTQDLVFPEASKVISLENANQVFTDTPMIELQYFLPQMMYPQTPEPQRVILVYHLNNKYPGGAIDALSGKPVTFEPQVGTYRSMGAANSVTVATPVEDAISAIKSPTNQDTQENKQQISRDEAVNVVKKMIEIPTGFVLQNSSINSFGPNHNEQVWELWWNSESSNMGEQHYINARVNAKTGDFVGFDMSNATNSNDKSNPLTRTGAQKLAEDFLQRVQPEDFKLVKEESGMFYGGKMPSNIQGFNYVRVVDGIPVSSNGMNITVDAVARQVINYSKNWSNVEFPSPSNVLPLNQATERFLKERPLVLNYSLIPQQNGQLYGQLYGKPEVRLVYQPNNMNNGMFMPAMFDAITGDQVDWFGKSQSQWIKAHHYTDIQGNYAEKEIGIMGLTGAFGEYGETFRPDEKITVGSLLKAMLLTEGFGRDRVLNDEDVLKAAKERGWINDDLKLESELSRVDLSKIMIRLINMEPSAQVKGIYVVPFTDASTIQPDSLGYIAIAWGLGILKIDGNTLQPNQTVTRAEAAYAIVRAYAAKPLNSFMK